VFAPELNLSLIWRIMVLLLDKLTWYFIVTLDATEKCGL
jgi:hypothetical protein